MLKVVALSHITLVYKSLVGSTTGSRYRQQTFGEVVYMDVITINTASGIDVDSKENNLWMKFQSCYIFWSSFLIGLRNSTMFC